MIKSIAGLLSLLFVISTTYLLIFWGRFNIDVFQYISIEDIIKGVAYSMRSAILLAIIATLMIAASLVFEILKVDSTPRKVHDVKRQVQFLRVIIAATLLVIIIASSMIHTSLYELHTPLPTDLLTIIVYALPFISFLFAIAMYKLISIYFDNKNEEVVVTTEDTWLTKLIRRLKGPFKITKSPPPYTYSVVIQYASLGAFFYFLTSAITLGILNSEKIIRGIEYDYVTGMDASLVPSKFNKGIIYLGTISSKLIFADTLMQSYFLINKDSVPSLRVHHMDTALKQARLVQTLCDSVLNKRRVRR